MKRLLIIALLIASCSSDDGEESCQCENVMVLDQTDDTYKPVSLRTCDFQQNMIDRGAMVIENGVKYINTDSYENVWLQMSLEQGCR